MTTVLMVVHIILVIALIGTVLLQKSEGGALGMGGGSGGGAGGGLMSARGTANLLSRATAILATLFFLSSLGLALMFKGAQSGKSVITDDPVEQSIPATDATPAEPAPAAAPTAPSPADIPAAK